MGSRPALGGNWYSSSKAGRTDYAALLAFSVEAGAVLTLGPPGCAARPVVRLDVVALGALVVVVVHVARRGFGAVPR